VTHWPDTNIDSKPSETDFIGQIAAGYSHGWGAFNLAASLYYLIGNQQAGSVDLDTELRGPDNYDFELKDTWGVTLEPGYRLSDTTLVYAKLGYSQTSGKGNEFFEGVGYTYDTGYDAFTWGGGIKHLFSENIYGVAELIYSDYTGNTWSSEGESIELTPESLIGIIGVGYQF
jgi:opacity protein-like surface antigen